MVKLVDKCVENCYLNIIIIIMYFNIYLKVWGKEVRNFLYFKVYINFVCYYKYDSDIIFRC